MERWSDGLQVRTNADALTSSIDYSIPIELKYSLHVKGADEHDRACSQVERYAHMRGSASPVLFFLVRLSHIPELTGIAVCDLRGG